MALNPKAFACASAAAVAAMDAGGYVWHGLLGQPSIMNTLYPGFWGNWTLMFTGLVATVISAYAVGYLFAWLYNRQEKKR